MAEVHEFELAGNDGVPCIDCDDFEGAIYLCGSGMMCERCFATLAEIPEEELFSDEKPLLDYQVPKEHTAKAKAKLMHRRTNGHG